MATNSFQRSPSKVWWIQGLEDEPHSDWLSRTGNGSPNSHKSQDSGFSDSEISPTLGTNVKSRRQKEKSSKEANQNLKTPHRFAPDSVPCDILKDIALTDNPTPKKNLTENVKEKYSSKKSVTKHLIDECLKKTKDQRIERHNPYCRSLPTTPNNHFHNHTFVTKSATQAHSPSHSPLLYQCSRLTLYNPEPKEKNTSDAESNQGTKKNHHGSPKVNRNLLKYFPKDLNDNLTKDDSANETRTSQNSDLPLHSVTLPIAQPSMKSKLNVTVPLYYQYNLDKIGTDFKDFNPVSPDSVRNSDDSEGSFDGSNDAVSSESFTYQNGEVSDCEKEVESFFTDHLEKLESPAHTSTPKVNYRKVESAPLRKRIAKQKKNVNLFDTVEKIPETNPLLLPQLPPVKWWLNEVEQLYEPECMITLQCKSIANDLARHVTQLAEGVMEPIRNMLEHSRIILKEFSKIKTQVERNRMEHIGPLAQSLVGNITEYVLKNMVNSQPGSLVDAKQTKKEIHNLLEVSGKLRQATTLSRPDLEEIFTLITKLQDMFYATEHNILAMQIQLLINAVEEPSSHLSLRGVLSGITSLALQCERLSSLVVEAGGPRVLLILCVECKASTIRTMALRTLATICCSTTAIRQLEQAEGIEVLADILSDSSRPEPELSEATAVLAQITAPWIEDNHSVKGLAEHISPIITAITDFLEKTKCCQNLLLCAAALANVTYMNVNAVNALVQNDTVGKLLTAVRNRGPKASVFLKEQTATLIANLSDIPEFREYLAENNAGVALLCFLQIYPINSQDEAQTNAAQRLQQKSAIALSRLCSDAKVAQQIVDLGGVTRLVQLCKEGKERNNSDAVLVACLATLRKIVANCGNEIMDQKDIMELVEPRLLDSFLAYSSQNESYV